MSELPSQGQFRAPMCDRAKMHEMVDYLTAQFVEKLGADEFAEYARALLPTMYHGGVDVVFDTAESEIEKMFLGSLLIGFLSTDPLGLMFNNPAADAPDMVSNRRDCFKTVREMREKMDANPDGKTLEEACDEIERQAWMSDDELRWWRSLNIVEPLLRNTFHVIPQAGFPHLKVGKRGIRADLLLWVPNRPDVLIVVECDGYKYHGNQDSFTSDRKRDRLLGANGYRVVRYSGSEIYHEPMTCAAELVKSLGAMRERWLDEETAA